MKTYTQAEWHQRMRDQGVAELTDVAFVCVACGTVQSMRDFVACGRTAEQAQTQIGFSCVGRWTNAGPPPAQPIEGNTKGCNWSLGGLFSIHTVEVVLEDGNTHPAFDLATTEQAQEHAKKWVGGSAPR